MGMNYIRGLSADMEDLPTRKGQEEAKKFFEHFVWCVEQKQYEPCYLKTTKANHVPASVPADSSTAVDYQRDVVIITDATPDNTGLNAMISRFQKKLTVKSRIVNIREYPLKGRMPWLLPLCFRRHLYLHRWF